MRKEIRKIGIDVDGVLADFALHYAVHYNEIHPDEHLTKDKVSKNWDVRQATGTQDELWKIPGFMQQMPLVADAEEGFRWIYRNYETYIVTAVPFHQQADRATWIQTIWPEVNDWDIIFTNRKELINVDVMIDDGPHNLLACGPERSLIFDYPYNRPSLENDYAFADGWRRVLNWRQLTAWVRENCTPDCTRVSNGRLH